MYETHPAHTILYLLQVLLIKIIFKDDLRDHFFSYYCVFGISISRL